MQERIKTILGSLNIHEVSCSRVLKGRGGGDVFVSLSAKVEGLSLQDVRIATLLLGLEVDTLAYDRALACGVKSQDEVEREVKIMRHNYSVRLVDLIGE